MTPTYPPTPYLVGLFSEGTSDKQGRKAMRIARITPPRLRSKDEEGKRSATWLELFYDLAFVVAIAVLGDRLHQEISWGGLAAFVGYFALLWWLWASHTFYADRYDTDDLVFRLLATAQMAAIVVIAASLSTGATGSTFVFAVAYTAARILLLVNYGRVHRQVAETRGLVRGYLIGFGAGAVVWAASIFFPEPARFWVWGIALAIDLVTPWAMRREQARIPLDVSHLPERFGLFTILVLGESIAAVVTGLAQSGWSMTSVLTAAIGVAVATALWWMYFDNAEGSVVRRRDMGGRTWRPTGWIYAHMPLAAALATIGVALDNAVSTSGEGPIDQPVRLLFVGAVAVALASMALIQHASLTHPQAALNRAITLNRLAGIPFVVLIGVLSGLEAAWIGLGVLGVCVAEVIADMTASAVSQ